MGACLEELERRLRASGYAYEVLDHEPVATTQEAAAADSISGYDFAKAVVVMVDGRPQLHVLRAADVVDLTSVAATQNAREARVARDGEFEHLFPGCESGSPPPIALVPDLPVRVDRRLLEGHDRIAFEAGDGTHAIRMRTDDYLHFSGGQRADFAEVLRGKGRQRPRPQGINWRQWSKRGGLTLGLGFASIAGMRVLGRVLPNRTSRTFAIGATTGAAAAALSDPHLGARRRAYLRDKTGRLVRQSRWWTSRKGRYLQGRGEGLRHDLREMTPDLARGDG